MSSPNPLTGNVRTEEYINDNFVPGDRLAIVLRNREHENAPVVPKSPTLPANWGSS